MFEWFKNFFKVKPYRIPKTFKLNRNGSWYSETFDPSGLKGTIQSSENVFWIIQPGDLLVYSLFGSGDKKELFKVVRTKIIKNRKEVKVWLKWLPSSYCSICKETYEAKAVIEECPKCKVMIM